MFGGRGSRVLLGGRRRVLLSGRGGVFLSGRSRVVLGWGSRVLRLAWRRNPDAGHLGRRRVCGSLSGVLRDVHGSVNGRGPSNLGLSVVLLRRDGGGPDGRVVHRGGGLDVDVGLSGRGLVVLRGGDGHRADGG